MKTKFISKFLITSVTLLGGVIANPMIVNATSGFDDYYNTTNQLQVKSFMTPNIYAPAFDCTVNPETITNDWFTYILDDAKWSSATNFNDEMRESFVEAVENGSWAVGESGYVDYGPWGIGQVYVYWSETPATINFDNANYRVSFSSTEVHQASISNKAYYRLSTDCTPEVSHYTVSPSSGTLTGPIYNQPSRNYSVTNATINYPLGYEGSSVVTAVEPQKINGNVECANGTSSSITAVHINSQNGFDANALLANPGMNGTDYSFRMWVESPYSLVVVCDGDTFYGPTVDDDPLTPQNELHSTYNWVCTKTADVPVCAAS